MILVTGATGQLGTAVIRQLLQKIPASQIAALVRDKQKTASLIDLGVTIRMGSYDDTEALDHAMQGIETLLLIAGTDEQNRVRQHQNVVDAARKATVQRIAYTSRALRDPATLVNQLMMGHFQTEDYIKASGLAYTLFQNILYMDAIPQFVGGDAVFERGIHLPAAQGKVAFALRSEMGEAIANALVGKSEDNITYQLTGSASYSFHDVADALTTLSGKPVAYTPAEPLTFETQLTGRGLPTIVAQRITRFITDIAHGQEDSVSPDLENLLGRKPMALNEGLALLYTL
ncbi:SDR family oxidoreductase [Spirosoma sp.]|uniref:SDR family oxidoreductase n=1 Tax=Spirosoma sp. TaxID=1899569 RepID=UPI0026286D1C|nr:SDR family oxidoreductase [Spirosoma sp.]MCX6216765.1 SDR family oxidoreductase [Spirosoma sp.]